MIQPLFLSMRFGGNMDRTRLKELLEVYTFEEIIELSDVEVLDALEYMVTYNILDLSWADEEFDSN